ncbi:hypothetical protein ACH6EH_06750 [Paenibacillus sp. JSM ZJ436]|uniref:hypothetical protein n=1 Tax=Paenibacillus sp. JSM ZJ436 TaxID=3376190 RepID=UPI00379B89CA
MKTLYINQLPQSKQEEIKAQLEAFGLTPDEVQDAMDSKVCDIEEIVKVNC